MPFETMDIAQVAGYLHMDAREVARLAARGKLPCRKRGGEFVFQKDQIDHWVETRLHHLSGERLTEIENGVRRHHGMELTEDALVVRRMIPPGGAAVPLAARTATAVLADLVDLAAACGLVHGREDLLEAIGQRERLCSTAILPYTALPHPRHPVPYDIADSFIVAGLSRRGIGFSAPDGTLTRLFFLICCKDETTHLHVLARLGRVLGRPGVIDSLLAAECPEVFLEVLGRSEGEAVSCPLDR